MVKDSYGNEEFHLDVPFTANEVTKAVKKPGPDGLLAEHLKAGDEAVNIWLRNILNAVVEFEDIPEVPKRGVIVPVYKASGTDPLCIDSYRDITLTSMVAKVLEFLLLDRLESIFVDTNQSVSIQKGSLMYRCNLSQRGSHFQGGSKVYVPIHSAEHFGGVPF